MLLSRQACRLLPALVLSPQRPQRRTPFLQRAIFDSSFLTRRGVWKVSREVLCPSGSLLQLVAGALLACQSFPAFRCLCSQSCLQCDIPHFL
jgi:hypothetical protein